MYVYFFRFLSIGHEPPEIIEQPEMLLYFSDLEGVRLPCIASGSPEPT